jgi:superfamily II DNA or RNA helicase
MSSKFFTNQNKDTLEKKINDNFKTDNNITHLDFLVGYIRLSGLKSIIENMEKFNSKILVGLKSDAEIYQSINKQKEFSKTQINDLENDIYFMEKIQQLIKNKKLIIKITKERNVHAKMYIFRNDPQDENVEYKGSVIVGSSNLTYNGLEKNYELNVEIKDDNSIKDAVKIFNDLWKDSEELTSNDIDKYIKPFLPKPKEIIKKDNDIFYQSLIHYFDNIIDNNIQIRSSIKPYEYQKDAINSAIVKINRYNGAILGDVVGLGKTIIAVGILHILQKDNNNDKIFKSLIIAPPSVHKQWKDTLKDFGIKNYELSTYDTLPKDANMQIIVIDESHKLKDHKSIRYENINNLCKFPFRKKVLLLSATLQNNTPEDIANQVYLFQDRNGSTLPTEVSLEKFFSPLIKKFKALKKETDLEKISKTTKDIANKIKANILKPLLVRRTRTDIENHPMYEKDIGKFPKLDKLDSIKYSLGDLTNSFMQTIDYLENKINYERFRILNNLNDNGKDKYKANSTYSISDNIFNDNDLSTLAKYSFIKRFESSFSAFKISLSNSILSLNQFIKDLKQNSLYVGAKSGDYLQRNISSREYFIDGDRIYYIKKTKNKKNNKKKEEKKYLKGSIFKKEDFKDIASYLDKLEKDLDFLNDLHDIWKDKKQDPKLDKFLEILNKNKNKKIVIFTEYADTLKHLESALSKRSKVLFITSSNRSNLENTIQNNFDANADLQVNDYDILITTDTLAEGVNLHRSNTLINYDLPWNPTKLMQRMGRINRIGSKFETLNVSSFKPVDESNNIIGLLEKSFLKLQSFHYTLGEDSKILFEDEEVQSFGINEDTDEELIYLQKIRDFKKNNPKKYERLKTNTQNAVSIIQDFKKDLSFFKIDNISYFYEKENSYKNIDFLTFIKYIENQKISKSKNTKIDECIDFYTRSLYTKEFTKNDSNSKLTKKDKEAIYLISDWYKNDIINEYNHDNIRKLLLSRASSTLSKKVLVLINSKEINKELGKLTSTSDTSIEIMAKADIKTKLFIEIKPKDK